MACSMALLHSRVREVVYVRPAKWGGGAAGVHGNSALNHKFDVFEATFELEDGEWDRLDIPDDVPV